MSEESGVAVGLVAPLHEAAVSALRAATAGNLEQAANCLAVVQESTEGVIRALRVLERLERRARKEGARWTT